MLIVFPFFFLVFFFFLFSDVFTETFFKCLMIGPIISKTKRWNSKTKLRVWERERKRDECVRSNVSDASRCHLWKFVLLEKTKQQICPVHFEVHSRTKRKFHMNCIRTRFDEIFACLNAEKTAQWIESNKQTTTKKKTIPNFYIIIFCSPLKKFEISFDVLPPTLHSFLKILFFVLFFCGFPPFIFINALNTPTKFFFKRGMMKAFFFVSFYRPPLFLIRNQYCGTSWDISCFSGWSFIVPPPPHPKRKRTWCLVSYLLTMSIE